MILTVWEGERGLCICGSFYRWLQSGFDCGVAERVGMGLRVKGGEGKCGEGGEMGERGERVRMVGMVEMGTMGEDGDDGENEN